MPLNLNELIKKAKDKGITTAYIDNKKSSSQALRPWQQESTLFLNNNKSITNRQQIGNKPATNRQQIGNKATTNNKQQNKKNTESDNKVATQPATLSTTNRQQTDNKPTTKFSFPSLVGLQRELVIFIYNECNIARSKITENLTLEYIGKAINTSPGCIKTTLQRLEAKKIIERIEYKNGRGGWSKYSIPDQLFQDLLQYETRNKLTTNRQQTDNKVATQPATQPTTALSSSSGINNLKTTTTTTSDTGNLNGVVISEEWNNLDIKPLSSIGFTTTHLSQIASQNKLSSQIVQDSIYTFAFDLQENDKAKSIKGDPINFFMGILRNGNPYLSPSNYESPQDKAMRLYLERQREVEQKRAGMEKEAIGLAFVDWFARLTDDQKRELLPETLRRNAKLEKNRMLEGSARNHFETEIWPSKKNEILHEIKATVVESEEVTKE